MIIITGSFDPITISGLNAIKEYLHLHKGQEIFIHPFQKSHTASLSDRLDMLKLALKPYRHLHVLSSCQGNKDQVITIEEKDEEEARGGKYRLIAPGARRIVFDRGLYLNDTVEHMCTPHRAVHSHGVAETAAKIAKAHHLDTWRAYEMGMLHDITKAFSDEENGRIITSLKPEWKDMSPKIWHSFTGFVFMKKEMYWNDAEIQHAIAHHTLGDGRSDFDRILYIADKIEPSRGYDTHVEMELACRDLKAASELIKKESEDYRKKTGK